MVRRVAGPFRSEWKQHSSAASEKPDRKKQPGISQASRYFAGGAQDASINRVSHANCKPEAHTEYAQQVAGATARAKPKDATPGRLGAGRRLWQDFVRGGHGVRGAREQREWMWMQISVDPIHFDRRKDNERSGRLRQRSVLQEHNRTLQMHGPKAVWNEVTGTKDWSALEDDFRTFLLADCPCPVPQQIVSRTLGVLSPFERH